MTTLGEDDDQWLGLSNLLTRREKLEYYSETPQDKEKDEVRKDFDWLSLKCHFLYQFEINSRWFWRFKEAVCGSYVLYKMSYQPQI